MTENINKPLTVAYEDFKATIINAVNNSGIPVFMVEIVLQSILNEVKPVAKRLYEDERTRYMAALMNMEKQEEVTENEVHE